MIKSTVLEFDDGEIEIEIDGEGGYFVNGTNLTEEELVELRDALNTFLGSQEGEDDEELPEIQAAYDDGYADGWNDAMGEPDEEDLN